MGREPGGPGCDDAVPVARGQGERLFGETMGWVLKVEGAFRLASRRPSPLGGAGRGRR